MYIYKTRQLINQFKDNSIYNTYKYTNAGSIILGFSWK